MEKLDNVLLFQAEHLAQRVEEEHCIALLIRDRQGRVLLVWENEANEEHGRRAGILSVPTETCTEEDLTVGNALKTGLMEEVTRNFENFRVVDSGYRCEELPKNHGTSDCYTRHGIVLLYDGLPQVNQFSSLHSEEIGGYGWFSFEELQQMHTAGFLEPEVFPFIQSYKEAGFLDKSTE